MIIGRLNKPLNYLDELVVEELVWLIEQDVSDRETHYETIRYTHQLAEINIHKGTDKSLFASKKSDSKSTKSNKVSTTKEDREREIEKLKQIFEIQ